MCLHHSVGMSTFEVVHNMNMVEMHATRVKSLLSKFDIKQIVE